MIGALKGMVDETGEDYAVIDVGGVGYTVFMSTRLLSTFSRGEAVKLAIETQVREDHIHLYGFEDTTMREWFRLLNSVQRVGSKMALAILSALHPTQIVQAVVSKDTTAFSRISGVGPKLAERIVVELKDKALKLPTSASSTPASATPQPASSGSRKKPAAQETTPAPMLPTEDAVSALANLGFSRSDAYAATLRAVEALGGEASLDQLIKISLKELAR